MSGLHITRRGALIGGLAVAGGAVVSGVVDLDEAWALDAPSIIGCDAWHARRSSQAVRIHDQRPVKVLVHHTATPNVTDLSRRAAEALAHGVQNFHMDRRGWLDSGQHFTISRGGFVLEGRHRSLEVLRAGRRQVEGAHCTGQNVVAVGIENEGTYTATGPTGEQWNRLRQMCAYICRQYGIRSTAIYGHRDFKDTACPGDVLYRKLPQLRKEVAGLLGDGTARQEGPAEEERRTFSSAAQVSWPLLRVADRGPEVLAAQHLLRACGLTDVVADGRFDRRTADAVRRFQAAHRTEEVNGMIGGESWPLLVSPEVAGSGRETTRAVAALTGSSRTGSGRTAEEWKRLLNR